MREQEQENAADIEDSKADNTVTNDDESKKEVGGRGGLDPTRYGDWEKAGRCIDF